MLRGSAKRRAAELKRDECPTVGKPKPPQRASSLHLDKAPRNGRLDTMALVKENEDSVANYTSADPPENPGQELPMASAPPVIHKASPVPALQELLTSGPRILNSFKDAYEQRKKIRGTSERERGTEGLTEAVAALLSAHLPKEYQDVLRRQDPHAPRPDQGFFYEMKSAFEKASSYPDVLRWFEETVKKNQLSPVEALAGLLTLYVETASIPPF